MVTIKIDQMNLRSGKAKNGRDWTIYEILSGGQKYESWRHAWNATWKVGDTVEAELEKSMWNGHPRYELKQPANAQKFNPLVQAQAMPANDNRFDAIEKKLSIILEKVDELLLRGNEAGME